MSETANDTPEVTKTTIYINMAFTTLENAVNSGTLTSKFNGTGQKIVLIPEAEELTYFYYSSDSEGKEKITPPFEINNGDKIKFKLNDTENSGLKFKWKDILQNCFDLQLVDGKKSTYLAKLTDGSSASENDDVLITISVNKKLEKIFVSWDPRVRIRK